MSDIKFIEGGIFTDYRGQISHVNDLDMQEIKRFYIIHQIHHQSCNSKSK